jgi:hypothetical protein
MSQLRVKSCGERPLVHKPVVDGVQDWIDGLRLPAGPPSRVQ